MALQKINTDLISADAVTAAKIADGAITADDIGANNITGAKIASNSILTRHIDDDQVTGDQLADALTVVTSVTSPLLVASTSARVTQVALTSTSNAVAWDAAAAQNAYHLTTENTTFAAPSNITEAANRGSISTGYDIDNSLKFEADNSEHLHRTPSSAGNTKTWTYSVWFKRTELGASAQLISALDTYMYFETNDQAW